jgi:hypothetical protein
MTNQRINGLSEGGKEKLLDHIVRTGNEAELPFDTAFKNLTEVVTRQMNNPNRELAFEPWYFAIGVAGTTYPTCLAEHETSDYEEVCLAYFASDFQIEPMAQAV